MAKAEAKTTGTHPLTPHHTHATAPPSTTRGLYRRRAIQMAVPVRSRAWGASCPRDAVTAGGCAGAGDSGRKRAVVGETARTWDRAAGDIGRAVCGRQSAGTSSECWSCGSVGMRAALCVPRYVSFTTTNVVAEPRRSRRGERPGVRWGEGDPALGVFAHLTPLDSSRATLVDDGASGSRGRTQVWPALLLWRTNGAAQRIGVRSCWAWGASACGRLSSSVACIGVLDAGSP
mmetsp:Transcript_63661/g.170577  ORF Transcript_63661/g.170577 Transcript_63661/m.170577 type:complete len:232 (+) Transcript_63661:22-717(+)